jgi:serine/threonine protein kinase
MILYWCGQIQGNLMEPDEKAVTINLERLSETNCPHCAESIDVSELPPFSDAECPHCEGHFEVPARIGNFLLLGLVGKGGMGSVYRAKDESLGRFVAIKVILPSLGEDEEFVATFRREAQAAAKLNHPHIAQIYSFGQQGKQPYIAMELVPGRGLDQLIDSGKRLDQGLVMQIGLDIAEGLSQADDIGLIHGDIKPENILLDEKMSGKLVDFGIASFVGQNEADGIWGTPYYIAPEKLRREKVDARSDIYCLGATLYHALAGKPPFDGDTPVEVVKARLERDPEPLREVRRDINEDVERIISRMLRSDASQRYPTYASLLSDLRKIVKTLNPTGARPKKLKKIVIKKRGGGARQVSKSPASAPAKSAPKIRAPHVTPTITGIHKPVTGSAAAVGAPKKANLSVEFRDRQRQVLVRVVWILFIIFGLLGLSVGGVVLKLNHDRKIRMRRTQHALATTQTAVVGANARVQVLVSKAVSRASATETLSKRTIDLTATVTGEPADDLLVLLAPPPEPEPVPEPVPAVTNAVSGATTNATTNVTAASEPEPEPVDEPRIRVLARQALKGMALVLEMARDARTMGLESAVLTTQAMASTRLGDVKNIAADLAVKQEALSAMQGKMDKVIGQVSQVLDDMEGIEESEAADRAAREAARKEEEKRRQEAEAKRRMAEEQAALVANDLAVIEGVVQAQQVALKQHAYGDVAQTLTRAASTLKSEEGRQAMHTHIQRTELLQGLVVFLTQQLNDHAFKWGWIQGRSPEDIVSATKRRIRLGDRFVPWEEVGTRQMFHMIKHYVTDSNRSVKLVDLGNQSMAAAIFCYMNRGYDAADRYAERAVKLNTRLERDRARLVPDAPPPAEDEDEGDDDAGGF